MKRIYNAPTTETTQLQSETLMQTVSAKSNTNQKIEGGSETSSMDARDYGFDEEWEEE